MQSPPRHRNRPGRHLWRLFVKALQPAAEQRQSLFDFVELLVL
jgi:hypothetical protein